MLLGNSSTFESSCWHCHSVSSDSDSEVDCDFLQKKLKDLSKVAWGLGGGEDNTRMDEVPESKVEEGGI